MNGRALVAWNLRRIRVERGVSQERLAFDAQLDRSYVGSLERDNGNPTVDVLDKLARVLNIHVSELFREPSKGAVVPETMKRGRKSSR